jgi:hypothetical protein
MAKTTIRSRLLLEAHLHHFPVGEGQHPLHVLEGVEMPLHDGSVLVDDLSLPTGPVVSEIAHVYKLGS